MSKIASITCAVVLAASFAMPAMAESTGTRQVTKHRAADSKAAAKVNVKDLIARAKAAITYQLKDPESVRWRGAAFHPLYGICIEVNAKNGFGGYTGFEPAFYSIRGGSPQFGGSAWSACGSMKLRGGYVRVNAGS